MRNQTKGKQILAIQCDISLANSLATTSRPVRMRLKNVFNWSTGIYSR